MQRGFAWSFSNPAKSARLQVRAFAKYKLQRAKNDRLDAALIAESVAGLTARQIAFDPHLVQLSEALRRIEQIEADIVQAKTQRDQTLRS